jgi:3-phenylpropionate/trans-cinnamate dioxygenase ferredoxin subunit
LTELARISAAAVPDGKAVHLEGGPDGVCLVRVDDRFFAVADRCTHADVRLSEGDIDADDCSVECWKHGSAFSLLDGEPQSLPATRPVAVFAVHRDGEDVVVTDR